MTPEDLISGIDDGILIEGDGSFSIDQQRYNFQFGGDAFWEIKGGKKRGMVSRVAYQARTHGLLACVRRHIAGQSYWQQFGASSDGKGEPSAGERREPRMRAVALPPDQRSAHRLRRPAVFTQQDVKNIIDQVIGYSKLPECEVNVQWTEDDFIRFANNGITTSGYRVTPADFDLQHHCR